MSKDSDKLRIKPATMPAGGWGSVGDVSTILTDQSVAVKDSRPAAQAEQAGRLRLRQLRLGQAGQSAPVRILRERRQGDRLGDSPASHRAEFFAHTLTELRAWSDHELEDQGRLTAPLRYDARQRQVRAGRLGRGVRRNRRARCAALDRKQVVFYAPGRASLETSYMYQLLARMYGTNNLPDSSNMCHETTSVGLPKTIGVPVGTVMLDDFEHTDCIFFFGQNVGMNSPRMLHQLQEARKRGVPIITFNPLRERGLVQLHQSAVAAGNADRHGDAISTQYHQVKAGGDTRRHHGHVQGADRAGRCGRGSRRTARARHRVHPRAHARLRRLRRRPCAPARWDDDRARIRPVASADGRGRARLCRIERGDRRVRHGPDPAPQRRAERDDAGQPAAAARQYRQAGRRHLPGARPLQRAGPAHGRHHRKAGTGAARQAEGQFGFEPPRDKGHEHGRGLRSACSTARCRPSSASAATSCAPCRKPC